MFPLLEMGFDVEGLELSADMIQLGEARAARMQLRPTVYQGDMTDWKNGKSYVSLLAPAFTLQLAKDPEATLRHWTRLLDEKGSIYLTVFMPYAELLGDLPENEWYHDHEVTLPNGRHGLLETRHRLDFENQRVEREHRYTLSGDPPQTHVSKQSIRWIEHAEMMTLLAGCGFRVETFFLDFDPAKVVENPDNVDFDGILTYHATRMAT